MTAHLVRHGAGREDRRHLAWRLILDALVLLAVWLILSSAAAA
jgi:hypothetical protein